MVIQLSNKKREFMGFLMGEGCFRVDRRKKKEWKTTFLYRPQINISLRADDAEMLRWAKKTYGGCLIRRDGRPQIPNQNPYYMWSMTSAKTCSVLVNEFLQSELPSNKREQVILLKEFCEIMINRWKKGHKGRRARWYSDDEIARKEAIYQELKLLKKYKVK